MEQAQTQPADAVQNGASILEKPPQTAYIARVSERVQNALAEAEAEEKLFELQQRKIKPYAQSDLVPQAFRGNIANCMIAFDMAKRMGANVLSVMQNLYVVHGTPAWSAKFAISMFNTCGRFSAIRYRFDGDADEYGCTAFSTELSTGEIIESPKITWKLVKNEGWLNKNGSKWKTMPDLMFRYRAAAYLIATTAPELLNGLRTQEEMEDVFGQERRAANAKPASFEVYDAPPAKQKSAASVIAEAVAEVADVIARTPPPTQDNSVAEETKRQIEADRENAIRKAREMKRQAAEAAQPEIIA